MLGDRRRSGFPRESGGDSWLETGTLRRLVDRRPILDQDRNKLGRSQTDKLERSAAVSSVPQRASWQGVSVELIGRCGLNSGKALTAVMKWQAYCGSWGFF